jgi:hypothetical protein
MSSQRQYPSSIFFLTRNVRLSYFLVDSYNYYSYYLVCFVQLVRFLFPYALLLVSLRIPFYGTDRFMWEAKDFILFIFSNFISYYLY